MKHLALCIAVLSILFCPALAEGAQTNTPSLIIVLLPGTSLADWERADAPHLHALMAQGALAVMNTRTARTPTDKARETPESALLTLGSGARAAGDASRAQFLPPGQIVLPSGGTASQLYQRRMGIAPAPGEWVDTQWPQALRANEGRGYGIHLGSLGDALILRGVDLRAGGGRYAFLAGCSSAGTVQAVSALTLPPTRPTCVVWDAGPNVAAADQTVALAMHLETQARGRVLALSPFASDGDYGRGARLTPVVLWGEGIHAGLLCSLSTRRAGLVTDTDFAPAVASYFGAALPSLAFGQAWMVQPVVHAQTRVMDLQNDAYRQARGMRILPGLAVALGLYVLACSIAFYVGRGIAAPAVFPLVGIAALLFSGSAGECALWLAGLGLCAAALTRFAGAARIATALCALVVGVLTVDLLRGDLLMHRSLLGYSAVEGARYYGIGNKSMGVMVGAALCLAWQAWPAAKPSPMRVLVIAGLVMLAALLGLPAFGAKAGSIFVTVPAFGALLWKISGRRIGRRAVLVLLSLAVFFMAGVVLLDRHSGGAGQSHVGQAAARITQGGWQEAGDIAARKLGVELHLLGHSLWAVPLWGSIVGLVVLARKRPGSQRLSALLSSGTVAGTTSLAFNDAGTVACALCLAIVWTMAYTESNK